MNGKLSIQTYHPKESVTKAPTIGPTQIPEFAATAQAYIIQIRFPVSKMSSALPAMTMVGNADANPVTKRPTMIAAKLSTVAIMMLKTQYIPAANTNSLFRPKDSEYGGKKTPPIA